MKFKKQYFFFFFGGGGGGRVRGWGEGGGQGRCERRSEVFVKIQKIFFFWVRGRVEGSGWVVRVDVNRTEKWSFCENSKNIFFLGAGSSGGVGLGGQGRCEQNREVEFL